MSHNFLNDRLSNWLGAQIYRTGFWLRWLVVCLSSLVIANFLLHPCALDMDETSHIGADIPAFWVVDHPHFGLDIYPCFWPFFGLIVTVLMVLILKKGVFPLICRPEDYYESD
ncbi:conserved hypothetical protein [Desulfovibrionales bacterium]